MRLVAFGQKFDVVSESHWFSYDYFIFDGVIALNAWRYIYALGSIEQKLKFPVYDDYILPFYYKEHPYPPLWKNFLLNLLPPISLDLPLWLSTRVCLKVAQTTTRDVL